MTAWLAAVGAAVVVAFGLGAVRGVVAKRLAGMVVATETRLDDIVFDLVNETKFLFLLVVGVYVGSYFVALPDDLRWTVDTAMVIALLVQGAFGAAT